MSNNFQLDINVIDIETYKDEGRFIPYCMCVLYFNKIYTFYGEDVIERFLQWCEINKINSTFYAHNLSFDGPFIIENLRSDKYDIDGYYFNNSIYHLKIKNKKIIHELNFKCSFKIFPLALEKIGRLLEVGSQKLFFPHNFVNKNNLDYIGPNPNNINDSNWNLKLECINYCKQDVLIVKNFLNKIWNTTKKIDNTLIHSANSISSLALKTFSKKFNNKHLNTSIELKFDTILRSAYFGGRCEVFGNLKENEKCFHFDFTGMYSQIMLENFCYGNMYINNNISEINGPGFYNVEIESVNMDVPILPYRNPKDSKLLFPNGTWTNTYWWEELVYFKENNGIIKKINYKIEFSKNDKPLEDFINSFQKIRKNGKFENIFWKLFVNSLSGRLGMKLSNETTKLILCEKELETLEEKEIIIKKKKINSVNIITYINKNSNNVVPSNVAITAAITAKARVKLHKSYLKVKENNGRLLYSDTDSIFAAFKHNVLDQTHGDITWSSQKKDTVVLDAIFAIPKGYAIKNINGSEVKLKGFSKNSITFEEFKNAFKDNKTVTTLQTQFKTNNIIPYLIKLEKNIKLNTYNKRTFNIDKSETTPLTI